MKRNTTDRGGLCGFESDAAFAAEFTRLVLAGRRSAEIARMLGIHRDGVLRIATRLGLTVRFRRDWTPETAQAGPDPEGVRELAEVRYYLDVRDHALSLLASDPGYPAAHRAWIDAERAVLPYLTTPGVVVDGRRVSVDSVGDVIVARHRKFDHHQPVMPRMLRVAGIERAATVGGQS